MPATETTRPPRLARALLRLALPAAQREGAIADLDERFREHAIATMGRRKARRWYWRQTIGALHPRVWRRRRPGGGSVTSGLREDLRFGTRTLAKTPGATAVIVLTLAVGIGINGAVFSLFNTIVLKPLPVEAPERVVFVPAARPQEGDDRLFASVPDLRDWQAGARSFEAMAAWVVRSVNVSDGSGLPERLAGARVTPEIFDVLRIEPALGRRLGPSDAQAGAEPVALIGFGVWERRYGADRSVIGRVVRTDGVPTTIVGVLPRELERSPFRPDLWLPLVPGPEDERRDSRYLSVVGRLRDGASLEEARSEVAAIAARLAVAYPGTNENVTALVQRFDEIFVDSANAAISWILLGAVGFLLLIACANVANLLLVRAAARRREMALRTALGGSRWRIIRQLLVESLLLSSLGGMVGAALAVWGAQTISVAIVAADPPPWWDFSVDWRVFGFLAAVSLATSLVAGLAPAWRGSRVDIHETLKEGADGSLGGSRGGLASLGGAFGGLLRRWGTGGWLPNGGAAGGSTGGRLGAGRLSGALVVAQMALALVLLVGAGLMTRSAVNVARYDVGIDPDGVLALSLRLPDGAYESHDARRAFHGELLGRVGALPGVESVALAASLPLQGRYQVTLELEDRPTAEGYPTLSATYQVVTPSYFELAGARALRGRTFDEADGAGAPVAVVDARFAARYWPDEDPIGKRLRWIDEAETRWIEVVGVVPDILAYLPASFLPDLPVVYVPYRQEPLLAMNLLVRDAGSLDSEARVQALATALRQEVQRLDADLPLFDIAPLEKEMAESTAGWTIVSALMGTLGAVALLLSCLGIYSVMAASVGRRRREIGVRMALGARSRQVVGLVVRAGMWQTFLGLAIGLLAGLAVTRVLGMFLFDVSATDPQTFGLAVLVLGATALAASWIPARRAARVDPLVALRSH